MVQLSNLILLTVAVLSLIQVNEATFSMFLQAITSALATIPLTAGPITGLVGAKLAIGVKLLYFLGYFGRQQPKPPRRAAAKKNPAPVRPPKQTLPLPYAVGGGAPTGFPNQFGGGAGGFPQGGGFGGGAGGFPQGGGGFGVGPGGFPQGAGGFGVGPGGFPQGGGGFGGGPGGFPQGGGGFGGGPGGFPQGGGFGGGPGGFPPGSGGAGGFPQGVGGFGGGAGFPQGGAGGGAGSLPQGGGGGAYGGFDPAELYQALAAQGIDPVAAMQGMNMESGGGFGNAQSYPPFGSGAASGGAGFSQSGGGNVPNFPMNAGGFGTIPGADGGYNMPHDDSNSLPPSDNLDAGPQDGGGSEDVESFFTFLRDMDDNTCISRLMCDIGSDPSFLGDFSENIHGIISSLDVMPSSGAYQYIAIMETGRREGGCGMRFPQCSDSDYEIVKNIAPTVGVPDNINSEAVNRL